MDVIGREIASNTAIIGDCWRRYRDPLCFHPEFSFTHATVDHRIDFLNPNDDAIHTQSIERFWSVLKRKLQIYGTNLGDALTDHSIEIPYIRTDGQTDDSFFGTFINDLVEIL